MGVCHYLYVGPYVEWRRPGRRGDVKLPPGIREAVERVVWDGPMDWQNYGGEMPEEVVGGVPHFCYRFVPSLDLTGGPDRRLSFSDKGGADAGALDLTSNDRDAELRWFEALYRDHLADLAGGFGSPPSVRWGVLTWLS